MTYIKNFLIISLFLHSLAHTDPHYILVSSDTLLKFISPNPDSSSDSIKYIYNNQPRITITLLPYTSKKLMNATVSSIETPTSKNEVDSLDLYYLDFWTINTISAIIKEIYIKRKDSIILSVHATDTNLIKYNEQLYTLSFYDNSIKMSKKRNLYQNTLHRLFTVLLNPLKCHLRNSSPLDKPKNTIIIKTNDSIFISLDNIYFDEISMTHNNYKIPQLNYTTKKPTILIDPIGRNISTKTILATLPILSNNQKIILLIHNKKIVLK